MPLASGQFGRIFENLVENTYTAGSDGRLSTYLPVLDSRGVDRVVAVAGGPPLFIQVKAHEHSRRDGRLSFHLPLTQVGVYPDWLACLVSGSPEALRDVYLVPGPDLLRLGERGHLVDGRDYVGATLSPDSPRWSPFAVGPSGLARRLLELAQPGLGIAPGRPVEPERSQEEGAFFETAVIETLLGAGDQLALYRPAVDFEGRDLLVQQALTAAYLYLQVNGTERVDAPGLARFQVRRRTFHPDPRLAFLFAYRPPGAPIEKVWLVSAPELEERCAAGDEQHLSFEARVRGSDPRWEDRRLDASELPRALLDLL